jgi:ferredoxin-NADP reductase
VKLTRVIRDVRPATARARSVTIDLGGTPFPYLAGQAILVGAHGAVRHRPFSIAAAPEDAVREDGLELLVGVDHEGHVGGDMQLAPGRLVDIEGPLGRFTFPGSPAERRFLFIAGGTGIAPLRAMLHHALTVPHEAIGLLFSARTPAEFAYEQEFRSLSGAGRIELELRVTRDVAPAWSGVRGRLRRDDLAPLVHGHATLCFVCGPPALVQEIPRMLAELGVPRERVKTEEWG